MKTLKIADQLTLPIDAICQTFAILAKRGVGKTHTASVMAEEMLKAGQPIIVYDPVGAWWGLKSSADGNKPGFTIIVFGGEHADIPLEQATGADVARAIVENRFSAILDCSLMRKGERIRFMTDFCETLYHLNREPIHFFVDEAQTIAPQNLKAMPEAARLLGAMEDIVLQGRRKGLGMTVISPRPAVVNTNIRSACEVIIAMQIVAPHDRKAIQEWVDLHGDDADRGRQMVESLSSLKRGEAWIWSPSWLEIFKRVKFRPRETFDSSATPTVGGKIVTPKRLADIDLSALKGRIAESIERAKDNDPAQLRKRIAELEKKLENQTDSEESQAREKLLCGRIEDLKATLIEASERSAALTKLLGEVASRQVLAPPMGDKIQVSKPKPNGTPIPKGELHRSDMWPDADRWERERQEDRTKSNGSVDGPGQRILNALAWWRAIGNDRPTRGQVAFVAGYTAGGGSFKTYLSRLSSSGYIECGGGQVNLTPASDGIWKADTTPKTLSAYHDRLFEVVTESPLVKILRVLIEARGEPMTAEEVGQAAGYEAGGGSFKTYLSRVSSLGLIDRSRGEIRPTNLLFPAGLQ